MLADSTLIMAQTFDDSGLSNLLNEFGGVIKTVGTIVIMVVALGCASILTIPKAINGFSKKRMGEGLTYVALTAAIIILAIVGVSGLFSIVDAANPVTESGGNTELLQ